MRRLLVAALLSAALLNAEAVWFSANGKAFHKSEKCMALSRSHHLYTAERADALKHGLHECSACYRKHGAAGAKHASAKNAWAQEVAKP